MQPLMLDRHNIFREQVLCKNHLRFEAICKNSDRIKKKGGKSKSESEENTYYHMYMRT